MSSSNPSTFVNVWCKHVVLDLPHHGVAAHKVKHSPHPQVDPLLVAVCIVVGVVHDVQANSRQTQSHDQFGHPEHPALACQAPGDQCPWPEIHAQSCGRFQVQPPIALSAQVVVLEIGVDAGTEGLGEVRRVAAVADGRNLHDSKVEPVSAPVVHSGAQDAHRVLHNIVFSRRATWVWESSARATTWA